MSRLATKATGRQPAVVGTTLTRADITERDGSQAVYLQRCRRMPPERRGYGASTHL